MGGRTLSAARTRSLAVGCSTRRIRGNATDVKLVQRAPIRHRRDEIVTIDYQLAQGDPRYQPRMNARRTYRPAPRSGLRTTVEVAANSAVGLGALFLLDNAAGLHMGTPGGLGGSLAAVAMILAGLASIVVPHRRRRAGRTRAVRLERVTAFAGRPQRSVA